jgi:hypothetical protein
MTRASILLTCIVALAACSPSTPFPSPSTSASGEPLPTSAASPVASTPVASAPVASTPSGAAAANPAEVKSGAYRPEIDPARFVAQVTNPYFPLPVGARWIYRGSAEAKGERDVVTVLDRTRTVMGVRCTVVRDAVRKGGRAVELTEDWYAQDVDGNVWYFGEETGAFRNGKKHTSGSWEAGVDGAQPGILMPSPPVVGVIYHQEFYPGHAEDRGEVLEVGASVDLPTGTYDDAIVTEDTTPLEPDVRERKYYVRGVGLAKEEELAGGGEVFELVRVTGV